MAKQTSEGPKKVLIAMDGSENAEYAFNWYMNFCHKGGNHVVLCHVADYKGLVHTPVMSLDSTLVMRMISEEENRIKLLLAKFTEMIKRSMVDGQVIRAVGEPGEAVVRTAKEQEVDYIVTGSRGLGTLRRTFLGSTSDYILHHSHIPVMIVQVPSTDH
ncbi:universal stress protein YxiE-like [Ylistrum balloti]|uniref:universal stress protein YxiE-like n=1 Tax=Ylistrum balloti TaxID=509963 RepID=UPI002905C320|nr:universal stress protein YxiE-like [Ylistrum balloti]